MVFPWNFRCPATEAMLLFLSWSTMYNNLEMYIVLILFFFYFDFPLFTQIVCIKVIYSASFYDFSKRSNDFAYFVEHPVYSILKMFLSLLLPFFIFWFGTVHSNDSVKVIYYWNFRCSEKGSVLDSSFKMYAVLILFFFLILFYKYLLKENV